MGMADGLGREVCHPLDKQTGAPGREQMLGDGLSSLSPSTYTQQGLVAPHVLTRHTHVSTPTTHSHMYVHTQLYSR